MKNAILSTILIVSIVGCSQNDEANLQSLQNFPQESAWQTFGPTLTTPKSSSQDIVDEFFASEEGGYFMITIGKNDPKNGVSFAEAKQDIEGVVEEISEINPDFGILAKSYGITALTHYYYTIANPSEEKDLEALSGYAEFLLEETPSNIRELLPAISALQGRWSEEKIAEASSKIITAAKEALSEYDMDKINAGTSDLSKPLQDVLALQRQQVQYLQSWSADAGM